MRAPSTIGLLLAALLAWCAAIPPAAAHEPAGGSDTSLLNPLRKYHRFRHLRPFARELKEFVELKKREGAVTEAAVYFRSLNDGVWIGVNEKAKFAPASLMKVPVMMIYFKAAESDPSVLERRIPYKKWSAYRQFAPSASGLREGEEYTADELIRAMILDSDNDAFRSVLPHLPIDAAEHLYRELGYSRSFKERGDFLSIKTYTGTFRVLYNATYLSEPMSAKALEYLTETKFDRGIQAGVPAGLRVAHKFGEHALPETPEVKQLHDVGVVYHPESPYLLGIMTRGTDYEAMCRVIREISEFVYREVDAQYSDQGLAGFEYEFEEEA